MVIFANAYGDLRLDRGGQEEDCRKRRGKIVERNSHFAAQREQKAEKIIHFPAF